MSPLMMRFFTLVGIALATASMQLKARAETPSGAQVQQVHAVPAAIHHDTRPAA
jgi:uncharacterized membrane protein YccF (DUF307 family)